MSRLDSYQKKKANMRILLYLVILIALIIFVFTAGIKFLINSSIFISNIGKKTTKTETQDTQDFTLPPEILDYPTATNSAKAIVSFRIALDKSYEVFVNDESIEKDISKEEQITQEVDLKKGENSFYIVMTDAKLKSKKNSETIKIIYSDTKPKLEITSPNSGDKVNRDEVSINGLTDKDIEVRINEMPVVLNSEYKFSQTVRLKEGENKFKILAFDMAGNKEEKEITVSYVKD